MGHHSIVVLISIHITGKVLVPFLFMYNVGLSRCQDRKREELVVLVANSCPTLCDPMDCSPPGSSVHGISQSWILEWVAISSSRGSSRPRNQTRVPCPAGRFFTVWATREAQFHPELPLSLPSVVLSKPRKTFDSFHISHSFLFHHSPYGTHSMLKKKYKYCTYRGKKSEAVSINLSN